MNSVNNPWLGVSLIALGLAAIVLFSWLKIPQGATAIAIMTLGIGVIQGMSHQTTNKELVTLRKSMSPPPGTLTPPARPPSLVDEFEKVQGNGPKEKTLSSPPPTMREGSSNPDKVHGK